MSKLPLPLNIQVVLDQLKNSETVFANKLLNWFANQEGVTIAKDEFNFSNKKIHRFYANLNTVENMGGFGRSLDETTAAVKACAEAIERKVQSLLINQKDILTLSLEQNLEMKISRLESAESIKKSFSNSNGWAVGFSVSAAIERVRNEALERHLLLLTFIKDGWNGFYEINRLTVDGTEFISLVSKYSLAGFSAGVGIAKSNKFKGVSFGYVCDTSDKILTSTKWEQAFYEAYDYLRVRSNLSNYKPGMDLISQELNNFLETDFDQSFSIQPENKSFGSQFKTSLSVFDLAPSLDLDFPFFAAVVHGYDLLPLYFKKSLSADGENQIRKILVNNNVQSPIPERHPIL